MEQGLSERVVSLCGYYSLGFLHLYSSRGSKHCMWLSLWICHKQHYKMFVLAYKPGNFCFGQKHGLCEQLCSTNNCYNFGMLFGKPWLWLFKLQHAKFLAAGITNLDHNWWISSCYLVGN